MARIQRELTPREQREADRTRERLAELAALMGLFWVRRARSLLPLASVQTSEQFLRSASIVTAGSIGAIRFRAVQEGVQAARDQLPGLTIEVPPVSTITGLYPAPTTVRKHVRALADEIRKAEAEGASKVEATERAIITLEKPGIRIAETETSQTWNLGKRKAAIKAAKRAGLVALERWVTEFGPNTCERCDHADGETIRLGDTFTEGIPGAVHPHCHCTTIILYERPETAWLLTG